jgi:hypothetical protein
MCLIEQQLRKCDRIKRPAMTSAHLRPRDQEKEEAMRTAILVGEDQATLTITTSEDVYLEQMGVTDRIRLNRGVNDVVVGRGVFKVMSNNGVTVVADTLAFQVATGGDKDGGPIELRSDLPGVDPSAVAAFLADAKGHAPPR